MVIHLLLFCFGLWKKKNPKLEEWAKGFCSKFMCTRKVWTCRCLSPYDLLFKLTNDPLQSIFDNVKTQKWLSNYWWECEKVLKEFMFKSLKCKPIYKNFDYMVLHLNVKLLLFNVPKSYVKMVCRGSSYYYIALKAIP